MTTLDVHAGLADKALGQRIVAATNAGLVELLRVVARRISGERGSVTIDDLRVYAAEHGLEPSSPNAYGVLFIEPGWEMVGRCRSALPSNRGREVKVWRWRG